MALTAAWGGRMVAVGEEAMEMPQVGGHSPFPLQPSCCGEPLCSSPTHLTPAQPHSPMANVFSNSCTRIGEGKRLSLEFNSFPSWRGGWGRRGSAGLRSVGKAPVLHGWGWQLVHISGSEGTGPQALAGTILLILLGCSSPFLSQDRCSPQSC